MKKTKEIICSLVILTSVTNLSATTYERFSCSEWAAGMLEIIEEEDDCFDAETYNALYNELYQNCINR